MFSAIKSPFESADASPLGTETFSLTPQEPELAPNLEIKELEVTDKGIRLKYERFNQARKSGGGVPKAETVGSPDHVPRRPHKLIEQEAVKEEGFYPKRGECSANYSDRINSNLKLIAQELLTICGLNPEIWDNQYLAIAKINFFEVEDKNGLLTMAISAKIKSRNELLNAPQAFSVPKISQDVLLESNLKSAIAELILDLKDFYYGKVKYEQTSLFSESLDAQ